MIVVYEEASGRVRWISRGHGGTGDLEPGLAAITVADAGEKADEVYVAGGGLVARPRMNLDWHYEESTGMVVVDRIPPGTAVHTPNWDGIVDDGFIAWPVAEPGQYMLAFECFPYHPEYISADIT